MEQTLSLDNIEEFAQQKIFPILEKGDPNWDRPHAEAVAFHIKKICEENPGFNLDMQVMILAAYLHDIGYSIFYKNGYSLNREEYMLAKQKHMSVGVEMAEKILATIDLSDSQKHKILHLINIHDQLENLNTKEELVFMEADTLGGLDVNFVKPAFTVDENSKHMESIVKKRFPKFISDYGKAQFRDLMSARNRYYGINS